ncbi:MAG: D-alanyl-lipoteichoic acid biosynthesis protein DltB [Chloroflexi bacterium]|nr:D-alanyl-lipoteichoic acid biosynthesis protein DltB [Chloroflexota bacterium]
MVPYANLLYFGLLPYVTVPALLVGLVRRFSRAWILLATLAVIAVQYWPSQTLWHQAAVQAIWLVVGYAIFQWAIANGFLLLRRRTSHSWPAYAATLLALAPLLAVKFVPLVAPADQIGFLGISYLTFRSLDVVFSVQDRLISSLPVGQYFAYLLFFPTISSGPIDRFRRFATDWKRDRSWPEVLQDLDGAAHRIFRGLLYKFILAALIKQYWLDPAANGPHFLSIVSYMYAYSFYLFFDFAGYSNFAVGVSYILGVHPPENFNRPFLARNIRDFWDRWHISLSWWFRDHIYTRFVFAATKGRWFKSKYVASYLGFVLAMGMMGIWHGTQLHYILYGLYHAVLLISNDLLGRWNKQRKLWGGGPLWRAASVFLTFNLVCFGFLVFSGHLG